MPIVCKKDKSLVKSDAIGFNGDQRKAAIKETDLPPCTVCLITNGQS